MNKMKNLWECIFKKGAKFQKKPWIIAKKNVTVDTQIQKYFLKQFLHKGK